jgi:hypothetical protein
MKLIKFVIIALAVTMLFSAFNMLFAAGLSTNYSDVYLDNLKIGGAYNLSKTVNLPMWVMQKGGGKVDVVIETTIPGSIDLKQGYESIPDKSWITYSKTNLSLLSGEGGNVDVTITIPNDKKYMGKKYMAHVFITGLPSKGEGGVSIALGIKGKIYMTIAGDKLTDKEQKELKAQKNTSSQGLIIVPEKFYAEGTGGGAAVKVTENEPLKLINPSKEAVNITLTQTDPDPAGISAPEGYEKGKPGEMAFSKTKTTLKPDGVDNIGITIKPADNKAKLFYVIKISVKSKRIDIVKFVPVYLN